MSGRKEPAALEMLPPPNQLFLISFWAVPLRWVLDRQPNIYGFYFHANGAGSNQKNGLANSHPPALFAVLHAGGM